MSDRHTQTYLDTKEPSTLSREHFDCQVAHFDESIETGEQWFDGLLARLNEVAAGVRAA